MSVSDKIYHILSKKVSTAYLFSGGSIMSLIDKFKYNKIKYFIPTSEASSGFCSIGHNKSLNRLDSVIITTSGPGLTNIITPLTDAYCDRVPLLVISGDVSTHMQGKNAFQEAPAIKLTDPITHFNHTITKDDDIDEVFDYAFEYCEQNKQVHINIPKDVLSGIYKEKNHYFDDLFHFTNKYIKFDQKTIDHVTDIINNAKTPVLFVGRGCNEASSELMKLALTGSIPVTTTLHGLGVFEETHHLSLKMVGMHGSVKANMAIQNADCIICIGSRFDDRTVGNIDKYAPKAKHIIHINNNYTDFNKVIPNSINIYGDAKQVLNMLNIKIKKNDRSNWLKSLDQYPLSFKYDNDCLKQQHIIKLLNYQLNKLQLKKNLIMTTGVGNHQMYVAQLINHLYPNRLITSGSLGTMGSGCSMAIGAKIANPDKIVIAVDGDQSFNMMNDLGMIQNYQIGVKIILMNDSKQSMVNIWEKLFFNGNCIATCKTNPDYEILGKAFNINVITIKNGYNDNQILSLIKEFLEYDISKPIILNCIVESDYCLPLVPPGNGLDEMITYENINSYVADKSSPPS